MASLANSFSDELIFRLAAYDISLSPAGFSAHWFWTKNRGEAGWEILKLIGDSTPLLLGNEDEMLAAVGSGQAYLGYFVSGQAVISALDEYPDLAWSYIGDGQPIVFQKMAITQANDSLNSAKLFFDFLLSQEGQFTIASGGLMPYRADVSRISPLHLEKIADVVGQESLIFMSFDSQLSNQVLTAGFQQRWEAALRKPLVPGSDATPDVETEP
jgi:iron(III) transport system substrate-binding protein